MTEAQLQAAVINMAHAFGWIVAHFRAAQNQRGQWMTAVQGDGAGFPDLVLVRGDRLIFSELKTDTGRVSDNQRMWIDRLEQTGRAEVYVWRTSDYNRGDITAILKQRK